MKHDVHCYFNYIPESIFPITLYINECLLSDDMDMDDVISACLIVANTKNKLKELFQVSMLDAETTLMDPFPEGEKVAKMSLPYLLQLIC